MSAPKGRLEAKLEKLRALRHADRASRVDALRRALRDSSNYVAAKAAELAGECGDDALIPDLLDVYDGLFGADAAERDPQLWTKNAIARALRTLEHRDPAPFLRGLHHVQLEPVWGKLEDAAPNLRCICAQGLVDAELPAPDALRELLPHLVDAFAVVRVEAVSAIAQIGGHEAALLLRLKALAGDAEAEVVGACFTALFEREPAGATSFVVPFLEDRSDDVKAEAAAALALSRDPDAVQHVRRFLRGDTTRSVREATVTVCAGSPQPDVAELLLEIAGEADRNLAERAIDALAQSRFRDRVRDRARDLVERVGDRRLAAAYAAAFAPDD